MPPRPSKSPAKVRGASPKPVKSPAPAKTPATDKAAPAATSKTTPKSAKAAKGAKPEVEEEAPTPAAAPPAEPAAKSKTAPAAPAAAGKPKAIPESALAVGFFAVLLGLLFVLMNYSNPAPKISWCTANAFDKMLKDGTSDAVIMFMDESKKCGLCAELNKEIKEDSFLKAVAKQKKVKFGKIKCWKNQELCRRFGVAGDSPSDATGYPTILHFKAGEKVGPVYERTAAELKKWVDKL